MGSTVDEFKVVNESEYPKIVELLKARLPISGQVSVASCTKIICNFQVIFMHDFSPGLQHGPRVEHFSQGNDMLHAWRRLVPKCSNSDHIR